MSDRLVRAVGAVTRRAPAVPRGADRMLRKLHPPNGRGVRAKIRLRDGLTVNVDTSNFPEWRALFYGYWEADTARVIADHVARGGNAIDVGANAGLHTLVMAKKSENGLVIACDPNRAVASRIAENGLLNGLSNIAVEFVAVSDRDGTVPMYLPDQSSGANQAYASQSLHAGNAEFLDGLTATTVDALTVDTLVERHGLVSLDLLKIDAEGFDATVVRGATRTLRELRPAVIFEHVPAYWAANGFELADTIAELRDYGYHDFLSVDGNTLQPVDVSNAGSVNILAI